MERNQELESGSLADPKILKRGEVEDYFQPTSSFIANAYNDT